MSTSSGRLPRAGLMSARKDLSDQALELLLGLKEDGVSEAQRQHRLRAWAARSHAHAEACLTAQAIWDGVGEIDNLPWPKSSPKQDPAVALFGNTGRRRLFAPDRPHAGLAYPVLSAVGLAMVLMVSGWVWFAKRHPSQVLSAASYVTSAGEHEQVRLADGSSFVLGGQSSARTRFDQHRRVVYLDAGEALFDVAKDASRPFVVYVANTEVQAIGTSFNVWTHAEEVEVSVLEGVVRVAENQARNRSAAVANVQNSGVRQRASVELAPGQQVSYTASVGMGSVTQTDLNEVTAWRGGQLVFRGAPLGRVIADLARYSATEIYIRDAEVTALEFTGTVKPELVEQWLLGLERVFPLSITADEGRIELRYAAAKAGRSL